jgi:excisionase family DNA binding protein
MKKLMKPEEVAQILNVSVSTVHRLANSGQLLGRKVGKSYRFDPGQFEIGSMNSSNYPPAPATRPITPSIELQYDEDDKRGSL